MTDRFAGKVVVVTGGGRGIGRAVALQFAAEGAKVVVADLGGAVGGGGADASVAASTVDEIKAAGGAAIANTSDVATMAGAKSVIDQAIDAYGRIDVLFNGAGIVRPRRIDQLDEATWDEIVRVNMKSCYAMAHHAVPHMKRQRGGVILTNTSPSSFGHLGMACYAATKEALVAFTRCLAQELGEFGIRCNVLRPCADSRMATPEVIEDFKYITETLKLPPVGDRWLPGMNGEEPPCKAENVAAVTAWLCSPQMEALNGRVIYIAGGHVALEAEPELTRSRYHAAGWDLDSLLAPTVVGQFTWGQSNHFPPRPNPGE